MTVACLFDVKAIKLFFLFLFLVLGWNLENALRKKGLFFFLLLLSFVLSARAHFRILDEAN